jgi:hypothetical protein
MVARHEVMLFTKPLFDDMAAASKPVLAFFGIVDYRHLVPPEAGKRKIDYTEYEF